MVSLQTNCKRKTSIKVIPNKTTNGTLKLSGCSLKAPIETAKSLNLSKVNKRLSNMTKTYHLLWAYISTKKVTISMHADIHPTTTTLENFISLTRRINAIPKHASLFVKKFPLWQKCGKPKMVNEPTLNKLASRSDCELQYNKLNS